MEFKAGFLWAGVGALCLSALIAITIFLFGTFGELEIRLLATTLTIGWYSLVTSMVFGFSNRNLVVITSAGLFVSVVGVFTTLHLIWADSLNFDNDTEIQTAFVLFVLSFSLAHSSFLLKTLSSNVWQNGIIFGTIGFIAVVGVMLISLILSDFNIESELYYRFLAVAAVFDALGTALVPIVKKLIVVPATSIETR